MIRLEWMIRMREKRRYAVLAHIVVAIVRGDVFLVQIAMVCHRIPRPSGVASDPAYIIPVIPGARVVHHVVWVRFRGCE